MMDWNRSQQVVHKWQPFGVPHVQIQHEQIPHHIEIHHVDANQPPLIQPQQHQPQPQIIHQTSKASKSSTPHCLICNVHLGMFAKGGMEVFSDKVTTSLGKQQIHCVLGNILNEDLSTHQTHSNIICKKCFKLIDDIDALEDKLGNMKQVVSNKYTMTLSLVKRGMIGKAVVDEHTKDPLAVDPKKKGPSASPQKGRLRKLKAPWNNGQRAVKSCNIELKGGKVIVKKIEENIRIDDEMDNEDPVDEFGDMISSYICSVCDQPFDNKITLIKHMEKHGLNEDWLPCKICEQGFLTAESLAKHEKTHKKNNKAIVKGKALCKKKKKEFKCHYCDEVFTTLYKVKHHETKHTGEKPYACEVCGTRFRQKSNLSSHMKTSHTEIKKFKCEICDKEFKFKKVLKAHTMSIHTGERPYKCDYCDAGFVYRQHYKKHMRIHTGEKPYSCNVCGKTFNSSENCKAHMFTHTDKKPYECSACGAGFMRKPKLLNHIMQHPEIHNPEDYVKMNTPVIALETLEQKHTPHTDRSNDKTSGKSKTKKLVDLNNQGHQLIIEEEVPHFLIPAENREQGNYIFRVIQSPQTTSQYTTHNMDQW